jgi:hypothetical protein
MYLLYCHSADHSETGGFQFKNITPMTQKSPDVLVTKKGLSKVTHSLKVRKGELNAKLARKPEESISSSDRHWLDHEGNTVDERRVIETLEIASDYERGVEHRC